MSKNLNRRLSKLEELPVPSRMEMSDAWNRIILYALRSIGHSLDPHEEATLGDYDDAENKADLALIDRGLRSLPESQRDFRRKAQVRQLIRAFNGRGYFFSDSDRLDEDE